MIASAASLAGRIFSTTLPLIPVKEFSKLNSCSKNSLTDIPCFLCVYTQPINKRHSGPLAGRRAFPPFKKVLRPGQAGL